MYSKVAFLAVLVLVIEACSSVPVTGRRQLNLIPASELHAMSYQQYDQVIAEGPLSKDAAKTQQVKRVGQRIQKAVEDYMAQNGQASLLQGFEWEFNLIEDPNMVNAWCMPGGKVAFYTGILPICKTEAGIAVVMGHEVAHAVARHGNERMSQGMVQQLGLSSLGLALGENPTMTQQLLFQAVGMGSQLGVLKFSRTQESEADRLGLIFMAMAGYNPEEAPAFWERMSASSGGAAPPEFLSTHPSGQTRINDLKKHMPEAMRYYKP